MAKIDSYATVTPPVAGGDMLIGTDINDSNATKNFTVSQLATFINSGSGFIPYTGADQNVDLGSNTLTVDTANFLGGIQANNLQLTGNLNAPNSKIYLGFTPGTSGQVLTSQGTSGGVVWSGPINLQTVLSNGISLTDELNFQGTNAGLGTTGSGINAFGLGAASNNILRDNINAFGYYAAVNNTANNINAFGYQSCANNTGSSVNAMGISSADSNTGDFVNAIGEYAGSTNSGDNVIAIGYYAGYGNQLSNVTIISNAELPSYVDFAAASAAINVGAGASSGCTYLYHDQSTNSIGAVRIP